ncbi:hypothetical protein BpHYR1_020903 [Brachionus plicatilis]|uniref:Uncharacterized protein n=1 Tax=Brachionus plicatilis TaxID=10195 RepID=A0A3M7RE61_BRAPC|nr:hypothetical protein BpHYR1_020903 [Brachionus plicatilis]
MTNSMQLPLCQVGAVAQKVIETVYLKSKSIELDLLNGPKLVRPLKINSSINSVTGILTRLLSSRTDTNTSFEIVMLVIDCVSFKTHN